jgi:MSHA biogenesis protein MshG
MNGDLQSPAAMRRDGKSPPTIAWPVQMQMQKIPLERLSLWAGNLATCVSSGVDLPRALRASSRSLFGALPELVEAVAERVEAGSELSEALQPAAAHFPAFFLPVLQCGEQTGRLDETLRYLERHCKLLAEPARKVRNAWLYPLMIFALGWIIQLLAQLAASPPLALWFLLRSAVLYGGVVVLAVGLYRTPTGRLLVDRGRLRIPLLGSVERDLGINRFFHVFDLLYSTGGMRVEQMLRGACRAVTNAALKQDLLQAASAIERGETVSQALAHAEMIHPDYKALIQVGDESGSLEEAFARIAALTAEALDTRLTIFNQLFYRLILAPVVLALAVTATSLIRTLLSAP